MALGVKGMITKYSKYLLLFGITSSVAMLAIKIPAIYQKGKLLAELPFISISLLIICSPYIFMLRKASNLPDLKPLKINYALFAVLISLSGPGLLFTLIYIIPDAQNGIAIFFLVILQWLVIGVFTLIALVLARGRHATNT